MFVYKNKFRKIVYFLLTVAFIFPTLVNAQTRTPSGSSATGFDSVVFKIVQSLIEWVLAAAGIVGIIGLVIAVILWITAAGELDRISKAKDILVRSLIGIAVSVLGLVILNFIRMYV